MPNGRAAAGRAGHGHGYADAGRARAGPAADRRSATPRCRRCRAVDAAPTPAALRRFYIAIAFSQRGRPGPPGAPAELPLTALPDAAGRRCASTYDADARVARRGSRRAACRVPARPRAAGREPLPFDDVDAAPPAPPRPTPPAAGRPDALQRLPRARARSAGAAAAGAAEPPWQRAAAGAAQPGAAGDADVHRRRWSSSASAATRCARVRGTGRRVEGDAVAAASASRRSTCFRPPRRRACRRSPPKARSA